MLCILVINPVDFPSLRSLITISVGGVAVEGGGWQLKEVGEAVEGGRGGS